MKAMRLAPRAHRGSRARLAAGACCALLAVASASVAARAAESSPARNARTSRPAPPPPKGPAKLVRVVRPPQQPDLVARRQIAGGPAADEAALGVESPELRALRDAERELFPRAAPVPPTGWPSDFPLVVAPEDAPEVRWTGVPPSAPPPSLAPSPTQSPGDLSWLAHLELPDLPVRWDERVVRYLGFFRDDPRGRATFASLYRHSGRFRDLVRRALRAKGLPEDLVWVAMIESGFDATARSSAGAAGLWQFMPETARIYGLVVDRWLDQRYSAPLATAAATDLLGDLHRRFGSWELALAAYNMGYAGLAAVVRRYNTNDFWSLSKDEASLPWETTLYVPKILAAAVVAHNLADFGFGDLAVDAPVPADPVEIPAGTSFAAVAQAATCDAKDIEALNPELRAGRTPPADADGSPGSTYVVRVPAGKGAAVARLLAKLRKDAGPVDRYVVRFGETLEQVAASHKTTTQRLIELNAIAPGEVIRGGTVLLVPAVEEPPGAPARSDRPDRAATPARGQAAAKGEPQDPVSRPTVVVPAQTFVYPDRRRVFYRVLVGDTLREIAGALHVTVDELRRWNDLDAGARLEEGMTLQAFVAEDAELSRVVVLSENEVHVVAVGTDEFFSSLDQTKGLRRITVAAKAGDTLESIGRKFGCSCRTMERINRRGRNETLKPGDPVVVYAPGSISASVLAATASNAAAASAASPSAPAPNGPRPEPPIPDLLPEVSP